MKIYSLILIFLFIIISKISLYTINNKILLIKSLSKLERIQINDIISRAQYEFWIPNILINKKGSTIVTQLERTLAISKVIDEFGKRTIWSFLKNHAIKIRAKPRWWKFNRIWRLRGKWWGRFIRLSITFRAIYKWKAFLAVFLH